MSIASRLRETRELKGATQTQVSKETGINNKTLSGYERGISEPDLSTLLLLADYYSTTTDYLLGRADKPNNEDNDKPIDEPKTIAAHFDGEDYTDEEKEEIENFKKWVVERKRNKKDD